MESFIAAMSHKELEAKLDPLADNVIRISERGSRKQMAGFFMAEYFDSYGMGKVAASLRKIFEINQEKSDGRR